MGTVVDERIRGNALYLELRRSDGHFTNQYIYLPYVVSPKSKLIHPPLLMARQLTENGQKKQWKFRDTKASVEDIAFDPEGTIQQSLTLEAALLKGYEAFDTFIYNQLDAIANGDWKLHHVPVVAQMTRVDVQPSLEAQQPELLVNRLWRAREQAGFEKEYVGDLRLTAQPEGEKNGVVRRALERNPVFAKMLELDKMDTRLPETMAAFFAAPFNAEAEGALGKYMTQASIPGNRSDTQKTPEEKAAEEASIIKGEGTYKRPNGEEYFARKWGKHEDVAVLRAARSADQSILLYGPPGTGKTACAEAAYGEDLITVLGTGDMEVMDLVGQYVLDPISPTGYTWIDGPLVVAALDGRPILLDEVGIIDPKVLTVVYSLMDGRRELTVQANLSRGTVKAKPGFYVIGATNPNAPGVNLSEALLSRFAIHAEMTTDYDLAKRLGVDAMCVRASKNLAVQVMNREISWCPQMRELLAFRDLSKVFGVNWAYANMIASAPETDRAIVTKALESTTGEILLAASI